MAMFISRRSAALAVAFSALAASGAWAAPKTVTVMLSGAQEVPPVASPGKGALALAYDPETRQLSWTLDFSDLTGPATMAHFHGPAAPGQNGPVALSMAPKASPPPALSKDRRRFRLNRRRSFPLGSGMSMFTRRTIPRAKSEVSFRR